MNSVNKKKNHFINSVITFTTSMKSGKNRKNIPGASREFAPALHRVCITAWILKLIPIPVGLWNARLLSHTVTGAVAGDSGSVLKTGAVLLLLLALTKAFDFAANEHYRKAVSQALHRCKLLLYRRFLSCPLSVLYNMEHGQAVEMLNDDFDTVTGKSLNLYPGFFTGIAAFAAYLAFLLVRNFPAALALFVISGLQVIPPLLTKTAFQQSYGDTRDIEAEITNCTLSYYNGFDTIRMFGLKQWCLERLARLHKSYLKIGNRSEAAASAETALDQLIGNILTYGTYGLMGLFILQGYTGLDAGVEAIALSNGLYSAAKSIFETIPSFAVARTADRRLALLYDTSSAPEKRQVLYEVSSALERTQVLYEASSALERTQVLYEVSSAQKRTQVLYETSSALERTQDIKREASQGLHSSGKNSRAGDMKTSNGTPAFSNPNSTVKNSILLDNVSCGFDGRQILSGTCISISTRQISVIRGANGMGKSTLLKLILGMVQPDSGVITIDGIPPQALSRDSFPGQLFYLPQEDAAFPISAEELFTSVPGLNKEAAFDLASRFYLPEESLAQPIDTLSGGQRKKVFLALAFAVNPAVMLLDEPCNSLDAESREALVQLLRARCGGAVIITHDATFDHIADAFYTFQDSSGQRRIIADKCFR